MIAQLALNREAMAACVARALRSHAPEIISLVFLNSIGGRPSRLWRVSVAVMVLSYASFCQRSLAYELICHDSVADPENDRGRIQRR